MKKILFAICLTVSLHANALKYEILPMPKSDVKGVYITGIFVKDDFYEFEKLMTKYNTAKIFVFLDSTGGSVLDGLLLGAWLFDNDVPVGIANSKDTAAQCLSACSLAFLAARQKFFAANSTLGVHMFYLRDAENVGKSAAQISADTKAWITLVNKYAKVTKIHPEALATMYKTPSQTMYYFNRKQMERYGAIYVD